MNRVQRQIISGLSLFLVMASCLLAVAQKEQSATEAPGIAMGAQAPAFALKDQSGGSHSLESLLKKQTYVALVFYRSADW